MKKMTGAALTEFAIVALLFFMILFSVIEVGRLMFMWNALVEASRRGARIAAVCPFFDDYIKVATVIGKDRMPLVSPQNSPFLPGMNSNTNVAIFYYGTDTNTEDLTCMGASVPNQFPTIPSAVDSSGAPVCTTRSLTVPALSAPFVQFVQVSVFYQSRFLAPVIGDIFKTYQAPYFSTMLPRESLGVLQSTSNPNPNHCAF